MSGVLGVNATSRTSYADLRRHGQEHDDSLKTSVTHPINVSFIVPPEFLCEPKHHQHFTSANGNLDLLDIYPSPMTGGPWPVAATAAIGAAAPLQSSSISGSNKSLEEDSTQEVLVTPLTEKDPEDLLRPLHGNLVLSSCPGKKVRLEGPARGRARINRDLESDLTRIAGFGVTTVVCCLNDAELAYLGAPWSHYLAVSKKLGLEVIRLPMIEGSVPEEPEDLDRVIEMIDQRVQKGGSVLAHCRGGVGRAGVVACCWLIRRGYAKSAVRAIQLVRARRSQRAIETRRQEDFIAEYEQRWKAKQKRSDPSDSTVLSNHSTDPTGIASACPSVRLMNEQEVIRIEPDGTGGVQVQDRLFDTADGSLAKGEGLRS